MFKQSIHILLASATFTMWGCNSASTTEKQASKRALPAIDAPLPTHGEFEKEFVTKFKTGKLPLKTNTEITIQDTISAQQVIKYILEPAQRAKLTTFADFWGDNEELKETTVKGLTDRFLNQEKSVFMVLNFGYASRLQLHPDYYTLMFQIVPTFMEGGYAYTYLANFDKEGKMTDAVQVGANAGYVDMQMFKVAEITEEGLIKIESKTIKRGGMQDGTADLTEFAYVHYKATEKGDLDVVSEKYTSYSGNFEGKEGVESFKIEQYPAHLQVNYQSAPDAFPQVELEIVQFNKDTRTIIAKHPEKNLQFTLVYDQDMKHIICKTSEGRTMQLGRKG